MLREWVETDRGPFAALNSDPSVMEHFPDLLTREQSDALADRISADLAERGFGLWAIEVVDDGAFIGFIGLLEVPFAAHFTPAVEIGWRLASSHWGRGYATEGARAAMSFGFVELGLNQIISMTTPANRRSRRVMEKLGMTRDPGDDFDHPRLPEGHPIRPHVLYRRDRERWETQTGRRRLGASPPHGARR